MKIKEELEILVKPYRNQSNVFPAQLAQLEKQFIQIIYKALRANGSEDAQIASSARKLALLFHPDSVSHPESVEWLEHKLGDYSSTEKLFSKAVCFDIFSRCKESLLQKEESAFPVSYQDLNIHQFKIFCENQKKTATTSMQLHFYKNCIDMLDQIQQYNQTVDMSQCRPFATFSHKVFPAAISATLGLFFFQEMFAFYGMCVIYNRLGHTLKNTQPISCRLFGTALEATTENVLLLTASSFTKIHALVTSMCNNSHGSIVKKFEHVQHFIQYILPNSEKKSILDLTNYTFKSPHLEQVIQPLKGYLKSNDQQFFKGMRCGQQKSDAVKECLHNLMIQEQINPIRSKEIWNTLATLACTEAIQQKGEVQTALLQCKTVFFSAFTSEITYEKLPDNTEKLAFN